MKVNRNLFESGGRQAKRKHDFLLAMISLKKYCLNVFGFKDQPPFPLLLDFDILSVVGDDTLHFGINDKGN